MAIDRYLAFGDDIEVRDPRYERTIHDVVDRILEDCPEVADLDRLEAELPRTLLVRVAAKLARSKMIVRGIGKPMHISITFAMYKEHTRLLPPDQHEHGEDLLARKIDQLNWLFEGSSVTWDMLAVDDGCPEGNGRIARSILEERFPNAPVQILFLEDAIREGLPLVSGIASTNESQKGGSLTLGMWTAAQTARENHVIIFTDLSTHLGQTGLLLGGVLQSDTDAAIGSRREPDSVVFKTGHRNTRGKLFIYLWKGMLAPLQAITDTQCGFKAFDADTVRAILTDHREMKFAIDLELLLKTELRHANSIRKTPVAWIDSEAASTTTDLQPYLPMLKSIAGMYREHLPATPEGDGIAALIEFMDEDQWQTLAERVPAPIVHGDPLAFGEDRPVSAAAMREVVGADGV